MRDIHISIVSHGQARYLDGLFAQLAAMPSVARAQVTLTLNVAEVLPAAVDSMPFPVRVLRNARPQGFAHNHNVAFREPPVPAEQQYFVVLNPDVELRGDLFAGLADRLRDAPEVGVIAPQVLAADGAREDSARYLPTPSRLVAKLFGRRGAWPVEVDDRPFQPDWVAGMCMLFPRQAFAEVDGFDTRYHLYYEDVDICSRLWLSGYTVMVDPRFSIIHAAQRSSHRNLRYARWHLQSMLRFFRSDVYRKARALHGRR